MPDFSFVSAVRSPVRRAQLALALLGALFLLVLLFAKKPWSVSVEPGGALRVGDYAVIWVWVAAAINLILCAFLGATAGWWMRPASARTVPAVPTPRWFAPLVLAAMVLSAVIGFPRLGHSLWHDEAYPVRNAIVGEYKMQEDGTLRLRPVKWSETLYNYKKPNHTLHSAVLRVFNDTWRTFARPTGLQFSETALRLPTYFAGIAAVGAIALFLRRLRFAEAAVIAAFLFALHPWQIRYGSEARAYAFVFLFVSLTFLFYVAALERGRWCAWLALGAAQFFLLWSYPTCIFIPLVLNIAVPILILRSGASDPLVQLGRWLVANVLAGMAFLMVFLPCLPQLLNYLKTTHGLGDVDYRWTVSFFSHLLAGIPWSDTLRFDSPYIELYPWALAHPGLMVVIAFAAITLLVLGTRKFILANGAIGVVLVLAIFVPAMWTYMDMRWRSNHMYVWYVIYILPGVVALVAVGLSKFITSARSRGGAILGGVVVAALLVLYAAWTAPQREFLRDHPLQANRESVLMTRPTLDPNAPGQEEIVTATFFGEPFPYDPRMIFFRTMPEFVDLLSAADRDGKPLFVNVAYLMTVESEHPVKYRFLRESGLFDDLGLIQGFDWGMSRHVFRYRPGSAAGFDFSTIGDDAPVARME